MPKQSKATKIIERRIETAYRVRCCGIAINIMDIGKVFARGREIIATGAGDEQLASELHTFVTQLAQGSK